MSERGEATTGAGSRAPARLILVYADWCPHCRPLSLELAPRLARALGVPLGLLDIEDRAQERLADEIVKAYGDWVEDYLIPQLFLEWNDGRVTHLLTGIPGDPEEGTRAAWERLLDEGPRLIEAYRYS